MNIQGKLTEERLSQIADESFLIQKVSWDERIEMAREILALRAQLAELAAQARADWLEANDPQDGTDCVTPYDEYLYRAAPPVPVPFVVSGFPKFIDIGSTFGKTDSWVCESEGYNKGLTKAIEAIKAAGGSVVDE